MLLLINVDFIASLAVGCSRPLWLHNKLQHAKLEDFKTFLGKHKKETQNYHKVSDIRQCLCTFFPLTLPFQFLEVISKIVSHFL